MTTNVILHYPPGVFKAPIATSHSFVSPQPTEVAHPITVPAHAANPISVSHPVLVQQSRNLTTVNPAILMLHNPRFLFPIFTPPQPRTKFALPTLICPAAQATDQVLFEEPADPTKKHYLPRFQIAATQDGSSSVKWVSLESAGKAFRLVVNLTDATDSALSTGNIAIQVPTRYLLSANRNGQVQSWDSIQLRRPATR